MSVDRRYPSLRHDHGTGSPDAFDLTGAANGDVIQYNSTTGKWEPVALAAAVTTQPQLLSNTQFRIWQRHASRAVTGAVNGEWLADRWQFLQSGGTLVLDAAYDTSHPVVTGNGSLRFDVTTLDASLDTNDFIGVQYRVEGSDYVNLHQQECTLSFWAWSTVAGTYSVSFTNAGAPPTHSWVSEYVVAASTWTKVEIQVTPGTLGTWLVDEGTEGLRIRWAIRAGAGHRTSSLDQFVAGNDRAGSNQTHTWGSSTSDFFYLANPKFELGGNSTPMPKYNFQEDLARCKRYYEKSYSYNVAPATVTNAGARRWLLSGGMSSAMTMIVDTVQYSVEKMRDGTVTQYSTVTGTAGVWRDNSNTTDVAAAASNLSTSSYQGSATQSGLSISVDFQYHWTVEAELI